MWGWDLQRKFARLWRRAGWEGEGDGDGGEVLARVQSYSHLWRDYGEVGAFYMCEYNLILSFEMEYQHRLCRHNCFARTVMLDRGGVELVCSVLRPDMDVLEYGSGGSTTFFRWRARENRLSYPLVVRASCSFQSICQKLDKHGVWQQLGTKGNTQRIKADEANSWTWISWGLWR